LYSYLIYGPEDGLAIVILNRPEKLKAITHPMLQEIHAIIEEIRKDDRVRSVILTGNGRAFYLCTKKIKGRENDKDEDNGAVGN